MQRMTNLANSPETSDIRLLLRAHGEQRWLIYELVPVVRQLEQRDSLPEDQLGAALAYLEVLWIEARHRAFETDAAHAELEPPAGGDVSLHEKARRYHAAVRRLRYALARRVHELLAAGSGVSSNGATTNGATANGGSSSNGGSSANGAGASATNGGTPARRPASDRYANS
jgi:uncharacterized membrane protein YgcG